MGIDGSPNALQALQIVLRSMLREDCDELVVGHITNPKKEYLPFNLKPQYIEDTYESKIIHLGKKARFVSCEVDPAKGTKETLWALAHQNHATIMVTGYNGVKGPKADMTIAGSAVQYMALNSSLPVLVIKDPRPRTIKPDGLYRYAVCYDGSDQAKYALETACRTMGPEDRLTTITVKEKGVEEEEVRAAAQKVRDEHQHKGTYEHVMLDQEDGEPVYKCIKAFLKSQTGGTREYIDFVGCGNLGRGYATNNQKLGSLANILLRARNMNILFVPKASD